MVRKILEQKDWVRSRAIVKWLENCLWSIFLMPWNGRDIKNMLRREKWQAFVEAQTTDREVLEVFYPSLTLPQTSPWVEAGNSAPSPEPARTSWVIVDLKLNVPRRGLCSEQFCSRTNVFGILFSALCLPIGLKLDGHGKAKTLDVQYILKPAHLLCIDYGIVFFKV